MTTPRHAAAEWTLRILATLVGTVIAVASEVVAGFLVPLRFGTAYVPISWVIVVIGVFVAFWVARYGAGSGLALVLPVLAWFYTLYLLTTATAAGDLVIPGTWVGYGVLLLGLGAVMAAIYLMVVRPGGISYRTEPAKPAQRSPGKR